MTSATFSTSIEAQQAATLLESYRFELGAHDSRQWVSLWLESYRPSWIRDAVIEALYQGRYKSRSVRQILDLWQRRGQPIRHVTHEFESAVCREFGEVKIPTLTRTALPVSAASKSKGAGATAQTASGSHRRLSARPSKAVSFDLSAPTSPHDMAQDAASSPHQQYARDYAVSQGETIAGHSQSYTPTSSTSAQAHIDAQAKQQLQETLQAQRQLNGVLFSSARAIQPFKPALPFSAQTLRLAKQKAEAVAQQR